MPEEFSHCLASTLFRSGVFLLKKGHVYDMGRANNMAIVLPSDQVSRTHARLSWAEDKGSWVIQDLGSRNGTQVDDTPIREAVTLADRQVIRMGPFEIRYRRYRGDMAGLMSEVAVGLGETIAVPLYSKEAKISGVFKGTDLIELCQFLAFNMKSGALKVQGETGGLQGAIEFVSGQVAGAEDFVGDGVEAATRLLRLPAGTFEFKSPAPPGALKTKLERPYSTENLLLEIARESDEMKTRTTPQ